MKRHITLFFLLVSVISNTQELKKVKEKLKKGKAIYYVLKSDKSTKHGEYILKSLITKKNILKGNYFQGKKEGIWSEYFRSNGSLKKQGKYRRGVKTREWVYYNKKGKLVQVYNFDDNVLVWSKECETENKVDVLVNDKFVKSKLDCLPSCIGGLEQLQDDFLLAMKTAFPYGGEYYVPFTGIYVSVTISKSGTTKQIEFLDDRLKNETLKSFVKDYFYRKDLHWFPARLKNTSVESKIKFLFAINLKDLE